MQAFVERGSQILAERNGAAEVQERRTSNGTPLLTEVKESDMDGVFAGTNLAWRGASMLMSRLWGVYDENVTEKGESLFSTSALVTKAKASCCISGPSGPEVPLKPFVAVMSEIAKVFDVLGTAFAFVKEDITVKVEILERMFAASRGAFKTIQDLCRWEIEHKILDKRDSGTWHAVRLIWLLEFMEVFSRELSSTSKTMQECATQAYNVSLSPHHPFPVRAACSVALGRLPSRERFCELIRADEKRAVAELKEFTLLASPILASLKTFHRANNLARLE